MITYGNPDTVHAPLGPYSHTVHVPGGTELVFLSGQLGITPSGVTLPTLAEQAHQVFANIVALLAAHDLEPTDIIKLTTFMVPGVDRSVIRTARLKHFGNHQPASTALYVAQLADPKFLLEIEVVAARSRLATT